MSLATFLTTSAKLETLVHVVQSSSRIVYSSNHFKRLPAAEVTCMGFSTFIGLIWSDTYATVTYKLILDN